MRKLIYTLLLLMLVPILMGAQGYTSGRPDDRIITVDYAHHEIHEGTHFVAFHNAPLGNGGTYQLLINTPAASTGKDIHLIIETRGSAESNIVFREGTVVSDVGSAMSEVNRNRTSLNIAGTIITLAPTITSLGEVLMELHFGSGPQMGGDDRSENEWNLAPGTLYLVNATSEAGSNDLSILIDWYEDRGDAP